MRGHFAASGGQLRFDELILPCQTQLDYARSVGQAFPFLFITSFAMTSLWISFVPSNIRLIRESR